MTMTTNPSPLPSAPVGVELAALRVQEWLHAEHDLIVPVQEIEAAMRTPCSCPATEHALAQQPAAADEAMVERAWVAFCESAGSARQGIRAALTAALATQHQEPTTCKHDFRRDEDHGGACCQLCGEVRQ